MHDHVVVTLFFTTLYFLAKKGRDESSVNLAYIDKLPSAESTT